METYKRIEFICTYCGRKESRMPSMGRPQPGECPKRAKMNTGKKYPHKWVINRKY